jgi:hypothetical protein
MLSDLFMRSCWPSSSKGRILLECIYVLQFLCELCAYLLQALLSLPHIDKNVLFLFYFFLLEFDITFHLHVNFSFSINSNGYIV